MSKRKREDGSGGKRAVTWQQDRADQLTPFSRGVFITCVRGKERFALQDALQLFNDYLDRHTEETIPVNETADIEQAIADELGDLKKEPSKSARLTPLKTDTECVLFLKTAKTIDPVSLVHGICTQAERGRKSGGRFLRRLTPITASASADANLNGLKTCLEQVLPATFKTDTSITFRIEPSFRSHNILNRDIIIPVIAEAITDLGPHKVDLKDYEVLVMVEVIKGFLGISIVRDYIKLRKFNLSEICAVKAE